MPTWIILYLLCFATDNGEEEEVEGETEISDTKKSNWSQTSLEVY